MVNSAQIREKLTELRADAVQNAGTPKTIIYLQSLILTTDDKDDRFDLAGLLCMEFTRYNMHSDATRTLENLAREFSDDPVAWIGLAEHLIFGEEDYDRALTVSRIAIECARNAGRFVRDAYQNLARAARGIGDYDLLEDTLVSLLRIRTLSRRGDVVPEDDFIKDLPEGAIDPKVLNRYSKLVKAYRKKLGK